MDSGILHRAAFRALGKQAAGLAIAVFAVALLLGYQIWSSYEQAIQTAEIETRNYASIIEARLHATLRRADADLRELVRMIPVAALKKNAVPRFDRELHNLLVDHIVNFPEVAGLRITDANGERIYTSDREGTPRTNLSDRNYFRFLRDNPATDLVFSEVIISRLHGRPSVVVARALRDGQGVFCGTVTAVIELNHFQKLFQKLELGAGGIVSIYRSDNFSQVLRWPPADDKINVPLQQDSPTRSVLASGNKTATIQITSATDGVVRIYSYQVLDNYPFFVSVGIARTDAIANWRVRTLAVLLISVLSVALLIGLLIRLRESEVQLQCILGSTADGILAVDCAGKVIRTNQRFAELWHIPQSLMDGGDDRALLDYVMSQLADPAAFREKVQELYQSDAEQTDNVAFKDGRNFERFTSPLILNGSIVGRVWSFRDITAAKQFEQALHEAETRYRMLFELSPDGILIVDPETARLLEFNETAHSQLGYSREEFSRLTISDIDCVESPEDVAARIAKVIKEGRNQFDTRHRTKHGEIRNINVTAQYIQIMGRSVYHCIWRDITERKRAEEALHASEQQLRAFYDLDLVGLAITSPVKGWVRVNNCLCNLLEYSEQELRGMTWAQLTYPDDFAADAEQFDRLLANKIEGYSIEKRFVSRTGKVVPTQLVVRCTRKANGEVDYVTAMVEDITERKQREDEIHRLNADLERRVNERTANLVAANKELETFSYSVAHDLRTPLRGVASITRIIEEDYAGHFDNEGKDLMRRVQDAAKKMGELIEGLLKLSRLSRTEVFMGIVDLSALAHAIAATLKAGDPLRQVSFDITPKLEVRGDKALLANLLENLLGNAWKFTAKETAARIELGVAKQDGKPVYFVRDNGAGFDMAFAANLFRPFHRLHNDSEYQGHGIGLATVQRIVQRHGGRIWADAAVGQGTTFYFTLSAMFYFTLSG